jgi:ribosomal protein S18 acetylase RimI-like enzyme
MAQATPPAAISVKPLTPARWRDFEAVFNAKGCSIARGCWCMFYRRSGGGPPVPKGMTRGAANRAAFKALVDGGAFTGLVGYRGREPVGWISFGPRGDFAKLARSPLMKPVDDQAVWSIICFVVPSEHRGQGVARALLDAAVEYARRKKVRLLEAYPVDKPKRSNDEFMWFGAASMFDDAGFAEVARRKPARPVMRLEVAAERREAS